MDRRENKSFQQFFKEKKYLKLKNYLYNYLLRKRAVEKCLKNDRPELMLEVGSGISPIVTDAGNIVYSDISFEAVSILKQTWAKGYYVVADGTHLPFKANTYSHVICSEVLEHIETDRQMIAEIFRTLKKAQGILIVTVPHRKRYFGYDDRYVKHYRRYEINEITERLRSAGLQPVLIQKVLGPLEKITMILVVFLFSIMNRDRPVKMTSGQVLRSSLIDFMIFAVKWINWFYAGFVWLDAKIMPLSFATVILIKSKVSHEGSHSYDTAN
jgi:ubiquinone/menaquinone biosynthesis C-methylase UbiE